MLPLRIVETDREGFDEPIVELWRDDDFVGMADQTTGEVVTVNYCPRRNSRSRSAMLMLVQVGRP